MKNIKILSAVLFLEVVILAFCVVLYNFNFSKFKNFFVAATEWGTVGPKYPPRDLAISVSGIEIKLSWVAPQDPTGVLGYKIYRCENSLVCYPSKEIATMENGIFSYTDATVLSNTPYGYAVRAYGTANLSPLSNIEHIVSATAWMNSFLNTLETETATVSAQDTAQQTGNVSTENSTTINPFIEKMYMGVSGDQVKQLQTFLAKYPDIYPEGLVTGFFWSATYRAVGRFQIKYGVVANENSVGYGIVGPKTREKLNEIINQ